GNDGNGLGYRQSVQEAGVDHDARVVLQSKGGLLHIAAGYHLDNVAAEGLGKGPVTVIVGRHSHDGAGAVGGKDIVGNENGNLLAVYRVDTHNALELYAGLFLVQLGTLQVGLGSSLCLVSPDFLRVGELIHPLGNQCVLRREHHVGGAEQGVGTGGVYQNLISQ